MLGGEHIDGGIRHAARGVEIHGVSQIGDNDVVDRIGHTDVENAFRQTVTFDVC